MKPNLSLPVQFEEIPLNVLDDRFMRVKIYIAHTGENRNRCVFTKEVLEEMIPSLTYIPILGYLHKDISGIEDFMAHEEKLVIDKDGFSLKYFGHAYGVIPADNNARFEMRWAEDGVEREYLVTEGLIWRSKFPEVEEIFDRDGGYKSQSMELYSPSIEGYMDNEGLFHFVKAKFEGVCILGEGVTPAMISATIDKFSFANRIQTEISEMLTEFNTYFSAIKEKGDANVEEPIVNQEPETTPVTNFTEPPAEPSNTEPNATEPSAGTPAEPSTTFAKDDEDDEDKGDGENKDNKEDDEDDEDKKPAKFTRLFELSHDDVRYNLYSALDNHESFSNSYYWISSVFNSHAIVEKEDENKFFKVNYVTHENAVEIGQFEEIFPMWVNQTEKSAIDMARTNFEAVQNELTSLRSFKANVELAEKEQKLKSYSAMLSADDYQTIKDSLSKFSLVEIEKEIGYMMLKKNNFSAQTQEDNSSNRVPATGHVDEIPYSGLARYFNEN